MNPEAGLPSLPQCLPRALCLDLEKHERADWNPLAELQGYPSPAWLPREAPGDLKLTLKVEEDTSLAQKRLDWAREKAELTFQS